MAGSRLAVLKIERDNLIDRWLSHKNGNDADLLVQIMDIEEDIRRVLKEDKKPAKKIS